LSIQEHRGIEGRKETSARPRMGPVEAVGAVAAMAGGKELHGALENGHKSHHIPREKVWEREEGTANLTTEKIGDGGSSGTAICGEGRSANLGAAAAVVSVHGERERERGNSRGARGKARLLFNRAEERGGGGTLPRRTSWATVAAAPGAGGSELRGEEDGTDRRGRAVSVCGEGSGGGCGQAERGARLGCWRWAERGGEVSWAEGKLGCGGRREGQRAEIQEGRGKNDSFLFFFYYFPNPFLNSNFNSF